MCAYSGKSVSMHFEEGLPHHTVEEEFLCFHYFLLRSVIVLVIEGRACLDIDLKVEDMI